jgi:mRNA interferase MazF
MSSPTTSYQFGDIVLVRFPFTSQAHFKQRPAVVVSNLQYNLKRPDVVLMASTSQFGSALGANDVPIVQWQAAGLLKSSSIKPIFSTIEQALILRALGALQETDVSALRTAIPKIIG